MKKKIITTICAVLLAAPAQTALSSVQHEVETFDRAELQCMATAIYHETKSETEHGKFAVAFVINERANSQKFPDTICKVVKQTKPNCQFTFHCKRLKVSNKEQYEEAEKVAYDFIVRKKHRDILPEGTLFFNSKSVRRFNRKVVAQIGGHVFYK